VFLFIVDESLQQPLPLEVLRFDFRANDVIG